jgi:anti-anti-sigma factor
LTLIGSKICVRPHQSAAAFFSSRGRKARNALSSILVRLRISTRQVGSVIIVDCYGQLVFGEETNLLREQVKGLLPASPHMVLNLRNLIYLDSVGVGTLLELFASSRKAGGGLKLAGLSKQVRDVLHITRLIAVFEVFPDELAAVASFRQQPA